MVRFSLGGSNKTKQYNIISHCSANRGMHCRSGVMSFRENALRSTIRITIDYNVDCSLSSRFHGVPTDRDGNNINAEGSIKRLTDIDK